MPQELLRVLVLSGGGSKGAWQVGVLKGLRDQGLTNGHYDGMFGVSTGALSAAVLAQEGLDGFTAGVDRLEAIYDGIRGKRDILSGGDGWISRIVNLLRHGGMYSTRPLGRLLQRNVSEENLRDSGVYLGIGYTDLVSGEYRVASPHNTLDGTLLDYILDSASQPFFMRLADAGFADGGVRNQTPLNDAVKWARHERMPGASIVIDVVLTSPLTPLARCNLDVRNAAQVLSRTFDMIEREIYINDLGQAVWRNKHPRAGDLKLLLRVYAPSYDLGDSMDFTPEHLFEMFQNGYYIGTEGMTQDVSTLA